MAEETKKTIPPVSLAGNDPAAIRAHARHAWEQIEAGHYGLKDLTEEDLGNGEVRYTFTRFETDPSVEAEHHGLDN